jgi:hypothetical protein
LMSSQEGEWYSSNDGNLGRDRYQQISILSSGVTGEKLLARLRGFLKHVVVQRLVPGSELRKKVWEGVDL